MGCVVGGVGRYTVLFAENALAMSNVKAGLVAGLPGGIAIGTRIIWAHLAEHRIRPPIALAIQSSLTALVMLMLWIAVAVGSWIMWPVAVISAVGLNAWNAVAMLYVIIGVPQQNSGRASGRVVMGFMSGLTIGGFFTGLAVDVTGAYETAWASLFVLSVIATLLAWRSGKDQHGSSLN
jgi:MFS family permease|tara:strand:- start:118 stop:654 length:537 start_codon:yes stop_codon:yes gene_type:complete